MEYAQQNNKASNNTQFMYSVDICNYLYKTKFSDFFSSIGAWL